MCRKCLEVIRFIICLTHRRDLNLSITVGQIRRQLVSRLHVEFWESWGSVTVRDHSQRPASAHLDGHTPTIQHSFTDSKAQKFSFELFSHLSFTRLNKNGWSISHSKGQVHKQWVHTKKHLYALSSTENGKTEFNLNKTDNFTELVQNDRVLFLIVSFSNILLFTIIVHAVSNCICALCITAVEGLPNETLKRRVFRDRFDFQAHDCLHMASTNHDPSVRLCLPTVHLQARQYSVQAEGSSAADKTGGDGPLLSPWYDVWVDAFCKLVYILSISFFLLLLCNYLHL